MGYKKYSDEFKRDVLAFGNGCLNTLTMIPIWKMAWWTAPLCAQTPVLPEPQKNGGQAEQALGRSGGGFSAKIHVTVDDLGNPLRLHLTAGQRHDIIKEHNMITDLAFDFVIAAMEPKIFWMQSAPGVLKR